MFSFIFVSDIITCLINLFINPRQFQLPAHLLSSHATMETVLLRSTSVTEIMTAKTTVMNLDVVRMMSWW